MEGTQQRSLGLGFLGLNNSPVTGSRPYSPSSREKFTACCSFASKGRRVSKEARKREQDAKKHLCVCVSTFV